MNLERRVYSRSLCITLLRFVIVLLLVLVIGSSGENFGHDQQQEKSKEATTSKPFLVSLSRSVPSARICFALELVNEGCCLTQPFEPLLGGKPVKLGVAVEVLGRALSQRTLEFFAR